MCDLLKAQPQLSETEKSLNTKIVNTPPLQNNTKEKSFSLERTHKPPAVLGFIFQCLWAPEGKILIVVCVHTPETISDYSAFYHLDWNASGSPRRSWKRFVWIFPREPADCSTWPHISNKSGWTGVLRPSLSCWKWIFNKKFHFVHMETTTWTMFELCNWSLPVFLDFISSSATFCSTISFKTAYFVQPKEKKKIKNKKRDKWVRSCFCKQILMKDLFNAGCLSWSNGPKLTARTLTTELPKPIQILDVASPLFFFFLHFCLSNSSNVLMWTSQYLHQPF